MNLSNISASIRILPLSLMPGIFLLYLLTSCSGENAATVEEAKNSKSQVKALTLIGNDDCLNCHNIQDKSVGPSYFKVAQRYETDTSTINRLAEKIIKGGGDLWGGAQMTKHPLLKKENAKKIVRWILSLDDSVAKVTTPGIKLAEAFEAKQYTGNKGLLIKAYSLVKSYNFSSDDFPEIPKNSNSINSGVVSTIHFPGQEYFEPLQDDFILQATGFITIEEYGKYFFKQEKTGKGRVILDGATIINENDWDKEIDKDLSPGTYPITIEYVAEKGKKALSLQWIPPGGQYYNVIPGEVFSQNSLE